MADDPKILGPDGVLRSTVNFSTTSENRFFTGTIPEETVELQVRINGSGWSSDASLAHWGDGDWTVPNPVSEPGGLFLSPGQNTVEVRAVLPTGSITPVALATIKLVSDSDTGLVAQIPTNIAVTRQNLSVTLQAEPSATEMFQGMNFYASVYEGGGSTGYTRINVERVTEGTAVSETEEFGSLDSEVLIKVDAEGDPVADPLYFRLKGNQQDSSAVSLQEDIDQVFEVPETSRELRCIATLYSVRDTVVYEFSHDRGAGPSSTPSTVQVGDFSSLSAETPLYYVATAVYYDPDKNLEYESAYSEEIVGNPVSVTGGLGSFPPVSRAVITQQFIQSIFRSNPQVKVEAGSVLRDTVIDPFSSESERLRFVLDFFHRARTPVLLLQIDDPQGTGASVTLNASPYKQALQQALYLSPTDVQPLIDAAFDAYASNYGKKRRSGTAAAGEVTFYTTKRPTSSILIPIGTVVSGGGTQFVTTRAASISLNQLASYYDPTTGRYQVNVPIRARTTGTSGNVARGQVKSVASTLSGTVSVYNSAAVAGGKGQESNLALTVRVHNALAGVDSGTARGYLQTAADVPGVVKANVVIAGDSLMQRDMDSDGVHRGGKVDIWIQGSNIATITDTFAFSFEVAQDIQFEIIGDVSGYKFRALDSALSEADPIVEMLDDEAAGYVFQNVSTGEVFDLTDVALPTYDTVQLSTEVTQPTVSLTDVILGSYRRRTGSTFVLPRQPVRSIVSVEGTVSGTLPASAYLLVSPDSPLEAGRSSLAGDYLQVDGYTASSGASVPSGESVAVSQEEHVLVGSYPEYLDNLGANFLSVRVYSVDRTILYRGPNDPSGTPDYTVSQGTQTTAMSITRTSSSAIASGTTVSVDYDHDENFTVTYTTNLIVSLTQEAVDLKKHATADVIAKEAIPILLDLDATILLKKGQDRSTVDKALRTNLANFFSGLRLGDPVRQSDIIRIIEVTDGVSYVVVPLYKMVPAEGSTLVWEEVSTDTAAESVLLSSLSTNQASVYLLTNELGFATTDGGGEDGVFKGVSQDNVTLDILDSASSLTSLGVEAARAYILGSEGRSITGYSDDATLAAAGYTTDASKQTRREELTANRVLVSLEVGTAPTSFAYRVTYEVGVDEGAKNIETNPVQFVAQGTLTLTYDEDR